VFAVIKLIISESTHTLPSMDSLL